MAQPANLKSFLASFMERELLDTLTRDAVFGGQAAFSMSTNTSPTEGDGKGGVFSFERLSELMRDMPRAPRSPFDFGYIPPARIKFERAPDEWKFKKYWFDTPIVMKPSAMHIIGVDYGFDEGVAVRSGKRLLRLSRSMRAFPPPTKHQGRKISRRQWKRQNARRRRLINRAAKMVLGS